MSSKEPEPTAPKAGALWARLFGMSSKTETAPEERATARDEEATLASPAHAEPAARMVLTEPDSVEATHDGPIAESRLIDPAPESVISDERREPPVAEVPPRPAEPCPACGTMR